MLYWPFLDYSISFVIIIPRLLDAVAKNCDCISLATAGSIQVHNAKIQSQPLPLCLSSKCHWYILWKQNHLQTYPHTVHVLRDQKTWWASRLCIHRGPKLQQQPDSHRKKTVKETQGIPELRNVVVYMSISIVIDLFDDQVIFVGGNLGCKEWQVHATDRTWGTEFANSSVRKMPTIAPWHQQSNATTLGTIFGSTCKYQLRMHRLQLPMSLAAAAKCKAVLGFAASNSTTSSPNL